MALTIRGLIDRLKKLKKDTSEKFQDTEGWFRRGKFTPVAEIKEYFTPEARGGQNFWSTSAAKWLADVQRRQEADGGLGQYFMPISLAKGEVKTGVKPVDYLGQQMGKYIVNTYLEGLKDIPQAVKQIIKPEEKEIAGIKVSKPVSRAIGVGRLGFDILRAIPDPTDIPFAAYEYLKGVSKAKQEGKTGWDITKSGIEAATYDKPVSLGEALGQSGAMKTVVDIAEIPILLFGGKIASKSDISKSLKNIEGVEQEVSSLVRASKNYDEFDPDTQIEILHRLKKFGDRIIPHITKSKKMKKLEVYDPEMWRKTTTAFLEDILAAKNSPDPYGYLGFGVRELRKMKEEPPKVKIKGIPKELEPLAKEAPGVKIKPPKEPPKPPPTTPPAGGGSISDDDLIKRLTEALRGAKQLRGVQEKLYSKARAQKFSKMLKAREKMAGELGFYEELGALKGELPKVEFESIRQNFNQEAIDRLFNMIKQNKALDEWEKLNAQVGLSKILGEKGGALPTKKEIEHLYQVFGKEFTEALLEKRPIFQKLTDAGLQLYNLPRSLMAGVADFSATFMQNAMFAFRHPILTAKNFKEQLKFFANEKAYKMAMEEIYSRPTYKKMKESGLALTEVGPIMSKREEQFMASWAEKIPGLGRVIKATGRAYTGFLNKMRADVFDQLYRTAKEVGVDADNPEFLKQLGYFINAATGRGSLGKLERAAPILAQGLFSARKLAATANMLNPMFYIRANPFVRKEALKTWAAFVGGGLTILGLAKLAGAEVGTDPTSADFGKIKIGNTRINIFGQYQQIARLLAQVFKGYVTSSTSGKRIALGEGYKPLTRWDIMMRFFEMKEHPTLSFIKGLISGTDQFGREFEVAPETVRRFLPMLMSDAYDLYQEHGPIGLLGLIPAALGFSVQTYGRKMPVIETSPTTGKKTVKLKFAPDLADVIVSKITGKPLTEIPKEQRQTIVEQKERESARKYLTEQANRLLQRVNKGEITMEEAQRELEDMYQKLVYKPTEITMGKTDISALSPVAISLGIDKYLGEPPKGTATRAKWESGRFKAAVKVFRSEDIDDETKRQLISALGQDIDDIEYYDIAVDDREVRRAVVDEAIQGAGEDRQAMLESLALLRYEVRGKRILTDTIINDLVDDGILSYNEGKYLKSIKYVKDKKTGRVTLKQKKGKGKKISTVRVAAPKLPSPAKLPSYKIGTVKIAPSKILGGAKVGTIKPPEIKPFTLTRGAGTVRIVSTEDLARKLRQGIRQPTIKVSFGR